MQKHERAHHSQRTPLGGAPRTPNHRFKKNFRRSVNGRKRRQALTFRR